MDAFITTLQRSLTKNFFRASNQLLISALGGECLCAKQVAKYLLVQECTEQPDVTYHSEFHNRKFNLQQFRKFIDDTCTTRNKIVSSSHLTQFPPEAIQLIASGKNIWDANKHQSPSATFFRKRFDDRYSPLPTNTQMTERGVKEGTICSAISS